MRWAVAVALGMGAWGGDVFAQPKPGGGKPPVTPPKAAPAPAPVDAAQAAEDQLMGSLANREMDSLLTHYFKKHNIAPEKQQAVRGTVAIRGLADPKLTPQRRRALLADAVKGVDNFIRSTKRRTSRENLNEITESVCVSEP